MMMKTFVSWSAFLVLSAARSCNAVDEATAARHLRVASFQKEPITASRALAEDLAISFQTPINCKEGYSLFQIDLTPDLYPAETSWKLTNTCTGEIIMTGGPFTKIDSQKKRTDYLCVDSTQGFEFTIEDTYDDGICCSFGDGAYTLFYDGKVAHTGDQFGSSETKEIKPCDSATPTWAPTVEVTGSPTVTITGSPTASPSEGVQTEAPTDSFTESPTAMATETPTESITTSPMTSDFKYFDTGAPTATDTATVSSDIDPSDTYIPDAPVEVVLVAVPSEVSAESPQGCLLDLEVDCPDCYNQTQAPTRCEGRPLEMSMHYSGGKCAMSAHCQDRRLASCTDYNGGPPTEQGTRSWVVVYDDSYETTYFRGWVSVNEHFLLSNNLERFPADLYIRISDSEYSTLRQEVYFRSSCSWNLELLNRFGAMTLTGWFNEEQGNITTATEKSVAVSTSITFPDAGTTGDSLTIESFSFSTSQSGEETVDLKDFTDSVAGIVMESHQELVVDVDLPLKASQNSVLATVTAISSSGEVCSGSRTIQFEGRGTQFSCGVSSHPMPTQMPSEAPSMAPSAPTAAPSEAPSNIYGCSGDEKLLEVSLTLDDWPEETSWSLSGNRCRYYRYYGNYCYWTTIMSSQNYKKVKGTTVKESMCVPVGTYYFYMYDSYGDGMCCEHGKGSYSVSLDGEVVESGGDFEWRENKYIYNRAEREVSKNSKDKNGDYREDTGEAWFYDEDYDEEGIPPPPPPPESPFDEQDVRSQYSK